ncbi:MAG: cupin domain-containing protein [Pseudanabaenaceae cyanobacterium bins.68]|nr:cupin domain-containing protein [Pseudanabaenaceae cyanobacterium bins.68]
MNPNLLDELISLYALGELTPQEAQLLEAELPLNSQREVLDRVNCLAYSAPPVPLPRSLKAKVLQKIQPQGFMPKRFKDLLWEPHPVVKGVMLALLHRDQTARQVSYLVQCAAGINYPAHQHHGLETLLILDGEIQIEDQIFQKGDIILSQPYSVHAPKITQECLFFVHTSLDDQFVEWNAGMLWQLLTTALKSRHGIGWDRMK